MNHGKRAVGFFWAAIAAGSAAWIFQGSGPGAPGASAVVGGPAPAFRMADTAGRVVSLADLKGKVVLLSFWATWCESCKEEMPALEEIYRRRRGEGLAVFAASIDESGRKAVLPYLAQHGLSYPVLIADSRTIRDYGVSGLPMSYLIDPAGKIVRKYAGPVDSGALENDILRELNKGDS